MYPNAKFPEFIEDSASAVAWAKKNMPLLCGCDKLYVGGSSAGGYITMMLCFDQKYLKAVGMSNSDIAGYWHDAGQPTFHFNVLRNEGYDPRRVIVDEHAPLYFVGLEKEYPTMQKFRDEFVVDEELLGRLRTMAVRDSVKLEGGEEEYRRSIPALSLQLKALLARDLWDMSEYMEIMNTRDDNFAKAYELVRQSKMDAVLMRCKE